MDHVMEDGAGKKWFLFFENGHNVYTPTLTGLGERSHLVSSDIGLDTHIIDVTQVLEYEDLNEVI
jgi:hypothetical protein